MSTPTPSSTFALRRTPAWGQVARAGRVGTRAVVRQHSLGPETCTRGTASEPLGVCRVVRRTPSNSNPAPSSPRRISNAAWTYARDYARCSSSITARRRNHGAIERLNCFPQQRCAGGPLRHRRYAQARLYRGVSSTPPWARSRASLRWLRSKGPGRASRLAGAFTAGGPSTTRAAIRAASWCSMAVCGSRSKAREYRRRQRR